MLFAIPFEDEYTLPGTTDVDFGGEPGRVGIASGEIDHICAAANRCFEAPVTPRDVVWSHSGIRPLFGDRAAKASKVTRDSVLELGRRQAPMLSVHGGKTTTFRRRAEQAVDMPARPLGASGAGWTREAPLPGGDVPDADIASFATRRPWLPARLLRHCVRHYGSGTDDLLVGCKCVEDPGEHIGAGLCAAEVNHLVRHEWALTSEDILWRSTRKGLGVPADGVVRPGTCLQAACAASWRRGASAAMARSG